MAKAAKIKTSKSKSPASLSSLAITQKKTRDVHFHSANTTTAYQGHLKRAREWLAERAADPREPPGLHLPPDADPGEPWEMDEIYQGMDEIPNPSSPQALVYYLTHKCVDEGCGFSTAEQIRAAFLKEWNDADVNDRYIGPWRVDEATQKVSGNPAKSSHVENFMKTLKHKNGIDGGFRNHSVAMSVEHMKLIHNYLTANVLNKSYMTLHEKDEHGRALFFLAFSTLSFTLWTRNSETIKLQRRHLAFGKFKNDASHSPYWIATLADRKGWQHRLDKEQTPGANVYEIHPQPETPHIDLDFHMKQWLEYLQKEVYCGPLQPNDFIFPVLGVHGNVKRDSYISHDVVQKMINSYAQQAGIDLGPDESFTTHCYRRGGAQYRFMYAPADQRFSLSAIRWWGGWAEGEQPNTLCRYLLDELHRYETGYSDALAPVQRESTRSFMGEHQLSEPATVGHVEHAFSRLNESITQRVRHEFTEVITSFLPLQLIPQTSNPTPYAASLPTPAIRRGASGMHHHWRIRKPASNALQQRISEAGQIPIDSIPPNLQVPGAPPGTPVGQRWKCWVDDWEKADPDRGLNTPLRDWPEAWYSGPTKAMAAQARFMRQTVALEYITCGRDDTTFLEKWPQALQGPSNLFKAIRGASPNFIPRSSKNRRITRSN